MDIATLIAAGRLSAGDLSAAADALASAGATPGATVWIDQGDAADIGFTGDRAAVRGVLERAFAHLDIVIQPAAHRAKRLFVADMDSTMIQCECIDELADYAGLKAEVAAVTERAMRGELDFSAALDGRVALLAGMPLDTLDRCRAERVRMTPGAATLVATMRARGAETLLVSGGFTSFADPVAAALGFDRAIANRLGVSDGALDGTVARPVVDAAAKRAALVESRTRLGLDPAQVLAVGDGANDVPMLVAAGLGVAYHAKPVAAEAADAAIRTGDLTALLWAQGIARRDWADPRH